MVDTSVLLLTNKSNEKREEVKWLSASYPVAWPVSHSPLMLSFFAVPQ